MLDGLKFWQSDDSLDLDDDLPPLEENTPTESRANDIEPEQGVPGDQGRDQEIPGQQGTPDSPRNQELPGRSPGDIDDGPDFDPGKTLQDKNADVEQRSPSQPTKGAAGSVDKDLELINSKLDSIKAILNNLDKRVEKIEQIAEHEQGTSDDPWKNF